MFFLRSFFFWYFGRNIYRTAVVSQPPPSPTFVFLPRKISGCPPAHRHFFFAKRSILNIWQCPKHVSLMITALLSNFYSSNLYSDLIPLYFVLNQKHSEFWHIQFSVFSDIYRHIQWYSALLRHSHTYWDTISAFWGIFSTLFHPCIYIHNLAIFRALVY